MGKSIIIYKKDWEEFKKTNRYKKYWGSTPPHVLKDDWEVVEYVEYCAGDPDIIGRPSVSSVYEENERIPNFETEIFDPPNRRILRRVWH